MNNRVIGRKIKGIILLLLLTLFLCACTRREELDNANDIISDDLLLETSEIPETEGVDTPVEQEETAMEPTKKSPTVIYIHVCGAVKEPGVYELDAGSRYYDAVEAAGGFNEGASKDYVNLASNLEDGCRVWIPTTKEVEEQLTANGGQLLETRMQTLIKDEQNENGLVNINSASLEELCTLPGIGASRAQSIIDYRDQNGGFQNIEDIMNVTGIKQAMYEKLKEKITV